MDMRILCVALSCLAAGMAAAGTLYRWVDERGVVQYSDLPPPAKARKAEAITPRGNVVETDKEGYALRQAKSLNPVKLFAGDCGLPCDQSQDFLKQHAIPFSLKLPGKEVEDAAELKRLVGALEVPVLQVGGTHHKGFDAKVWERLLQAAGYSLQGPRAGVSGSSTPP